MAGVASEDAPAERAGGLVEGARVAAEAVRRARAAAWLLALGLAGLALSGAWVLHRDARLVPVRLDAVPAAGALRVAGWVQPGLGIDDGRGHLPVRWRDDARPRSGTYVIAAGTVRDGVLEDAALSAPLLGVAFAAPTAEDRVRHLVAGLRLPNSDQPRTLDEAPVLSISSDALRLEGERLLPLVAGVPAPDAVAAGRLGAVQRAIADHLARRRGPSPEGRIYLAVDEAVPARTLALALASAAAAGAPRWRLVTRGALGPGFVEVTAPEVCEGEPDGHCQPRDLAEGRPEPAGPIDDLPLRDAIHVIGARIELLGDAPPALDAARVEATLQEDLAFKRCVAFGDAVDLQLWLLLDEAEPGPAGPTRAVRRTIVEKVAYPTASVRCVSRELSRIRLPAAAGPDLDAEVEVSLGLRVLPREDEDGARAYLAVRGRRAPFVKVPAILLERERLLVTAPFPLPGAAYRQGARVDPKSVDDPTAPLAVPRPSAGDATPFQQLGDALRVIQSSQPEGRWPLIVLTPGITAGELLRTVLAVRGRCHDLPCEQRSGYPSVIVGIASDAPAALPVTPPPQEAATEP